MKFLVDRCAGKRLADWIRQQGHDVLESSELGPDPGDRALLEIAAREKRIMITIPNTVVKLSEPIASAKSARVGVAGFFISWPPVPSTSGRGLG